MRISVSIITLITLMMFVGAQAATHEAQSVVQHTIDSVLEVLDAEKDTLDVHPERIYPLIDDLIVPHFDFVIMSRGILGSKIWTKTPEPQQDAFIEQFRTLLIRTYGKTLLEYSGQEISYLPAVVDQRTNVVTIKTEIVSSGSSQAISMIYRMLARDGAWKVIDISISGASIIGTYRGSFGSEIRKNGLDSLIEKLTERNQQSQNSI
jgi:phospholipid transport system substrate-binding protein